MLLHAPSTFDHDDEMKVVVLDSRDAGPAIRLAVESCPTRALTLVDTGTVASSEDTGAAH